MQRSIKAVRRTSGRVSFPLSKNDVSQKIKQVRQNAKSLYRKVTGEVDEHEAEFKSEERPYDLLGSR